MLATIRHIAQLPALLRGGIFPSGDGFGWQHPCTLLRNIATRWPVVVRASVPSIPTAPRVCAGTMMQLHAAHQIATNIPNRRPPMARSIIRLL